MSQQTYDHVIVGAGSAGCVLEHRLVSAGRFTPCVFSLDARLVRVEILAPRWPGPHAHPTCSVAPRNSSAAANWSARINDGTWPQPSNSTVLAHGRLAAMR